MKYKVISIINDGVIAANKNHIVCFDESSLRDKNGEDSLYRSDGIYLGQILSENNHKNANTYWQYSKKEWLKMNREFSLIQLDK